MDSRANLTKQRPRSSTPGEAERSQASRVVSMPGTDEPSESTRSPNPNNTRNNSSPPKQRQRPSMHSDPAVVFDQHPNGTKSMRLLGQYSQELGATQNEAEALFLEALDFDHPELFHHLNVRPQSRFALAQLVASLKAGENARLDMSSRQPETRTSTSTAVPQPLLPLPPPQSSPSMKDPAAMLPGEGPTLEQNPAPASALGLPAVLSLNELSRNPQESSAAAFPATPQQLPVSVPIVSAATAPVSLGPATSSTASVPPMAPTAAPVLAPVIVLASGVIVDDPNEVVNANGRWACRVQGCQGSMVNKRDRNRHERHSHSVFIRRR